jgi:hypothetical protein
MSYNVGDWVWANQTVQSLNTFSISISVNTFSNGDTIIVGYFFGSTTFGNINLTASSIENGFVAKIDSLGNWIWAKQISNTNSSYIESVKIKNDYAIVTGSYQGDIDFDEITLTGNSETSNTFVAKIDSSGNWIWVTSPISTTDNYSPVLEITNDGSIIVIGNFNTSITFGDITLDDDGANNYYNGYIAKLDSSGNNWIWAQKILCPAYIGLFTLDFLSNNNIVICGMMEVEATFGDITITSNNIITYIAKLDSSGNWLSAITFDDNHSSNNGCYGVTALSDDSIIITGSFNDSITFGDITLTSLVNTNAYVIKLDSSNNWIWGSTNSGEYGGTIYNIKSLPSGSAIIAGTFSTSITFGETILTSINDNIFVAKIDSLGNWLWAYCPTILTDNSSGPYPNIIFNLDINNNDIFITGSIRDNATFGESTITTSYNTAYVAKMYIGEDTNIIDNIQNELAAVSETTTNSILVNKNNAIKELYNIHNLKNFKLNYMLKNILNETENTNDIDLTANLINLYYK